MKKDQLEEFIKANQEAWNEGPEPTDALWNKIEAKLEPETKIKKLPNRNWYWSAAAVLFMALSAYLLLERVQLQSSSKEVAEVFQDAQLEQAEAYFSNQISQKRIQLASMLQDDPQLAAELLSELDMLDSAYQSLKVKLPAAANKNSVLDAMSQNLMLRIDLLNKQLDILKRLRQIESPENLSPSSENKVSA